MYHHVFASGLSHYYTSQSQQAASLTLLQQASATALPNSPEAREDEGSEDGELCSEEVEDSR